MILTLGVLSCVIYGLIYPHLFKKFSLMGMLKSMLAQLIVAGLLIICFNVVGIGKYNNLPTNFNKANYKKLVSLYKLPLYDVALAGFEDALFVLPLLPVKNPVILVPLLVASSAVFTKGHSYQGTSSMLVKIPYVSIAYFFASRYGILSTMLGHALNDVIALATWQFTVKKLCEQQNLSDIDVCMKELAESM